MENYHIVNTFNLLMAMLPIDGGHYEVFRKVREALDLFKSQTKEALPPLNDEEKQMCAEPYMDGLVRAIKNYRNRTGCDLRDSKEKCDAYVRGRIGR